jgi:hypothetical protein
MKSVSLGKLTALIRGASLHERQWVEMYERLVEFKETHGHTNMPAIIVELQNGDLEAG